MSSVNEVSSGQLNAEFFSACESLFCEVSFEYALRRVNPAWESTLGYHAEDLPGGAFLDLLHEEDRDSARQHIEYLATESSSVVFTTRVKHRGSGYHQILWQATAMPSEYGFYAVGIDISTSQREAPVAEHLKAEQALRENQALLSAIFEVANIGISLTDRHHRFVRINPAFCRMFGYHPHELLGQPISMLFPEDQSKTLQQAYQSAINENGSLAIREWVAQRKIGERFEAEIVTSRLYQYKRPYLVSLISDISSCKQALQVIRESERRLRLTLENLPVMVDALDKDGRMLLWNHECERVTGYSAEEMVGNPQALELLYPDPSYREQMALALKDTLGSDPGPRRREWQITCKDGTHKTIAWSVNTQIRIPGYDVWGIGEDVTERDKVLQQLKESEARLRQSEANLRVAIEHLPVMVDALDREGRIMLWNKECERVTGYSAEEMLENPDSLALIYPDPDYRTQVLEALRETVEGEPSDRRREWIVTCRDGSRKVVLWSMNSLIRVPGLEIWGIGEDVTERRQALENLREKEERLRQSENYLREVVENLPVMVDAMDEDGNILLWNRECERITGYSAEEMVGNPQALNLIYPEREYREHCLEAVHKAIEAEPGYRRGLWLLTCKDGSRKSIVWSVNTKLKIPGFAVWGVGEDVTQRELALAQLRENETRLRTLVENMPVMIEAFDENGQLVVWNRQCEKVTGYKASQMVGNPKALSLLYPDPGYRREVEAKARQQGNLLKYETEITCRDGNHKYIAWQDVSNEFPVVGWASWKIGEDITDRKRGQSVFARDSQLLADTLDSISTGVCATDGRQYLIYVNQAFCELTGYNADQLIEQPLGKVVAQESGSFVLRHYFSFLAGAHHTRYTEQRQIRPRQGEDFEVSMTAYRLAGGNGQNYVVWAVSRKD